MIRTQNKSCQQDVAIQARNKESNLHLQSGSDTVRDLLGGAGVLLVTGLLGTPLNCLVKSVLLLRGTGTGLLRG